MTEITDAQVAEIQWASSEQGKAAVRAGWGQAKRLGLDKPSGHDLDMADIGAIIYAAYLAAGWDAGPAEDEPAPAHEHHWSALGAQPYTPFTVIGEPQPHTIVLIRCTACGKPDSRTLPGEWALEDLREGD